jgi:class 3 adenylate cyclase
VVLQRRLQHRGSVLLDTVKRISAGDLAARTGQQGGDELAVLGRSIDEMAGRLEVSLEETRRHSLELEEQRAHSEKLLNNILPVLIADRLKKGESNIAETFPEVTVLFADIVGFTQLSASIPPRQLVHILNDIFGRFDELAVEHRLEKIKTIGDCYMVVGGVPERSPTHCQQVAHFAMAALQALDTYNAETGQQLQMRVGMHTGTVVAGIVGKQKYSYDLWGDVVNTASRLESAGQPGRIHVTEAVRVRLSDEYGFASRGPIDIKGKGLMETWFLEAEMGRAKG